MRFSLPGRRAGVVLVAAALAAAVGCGGEADREVTAAGPAGAVLEVRGPVTGQRADGPARVLAVGDEVFADDRIVTGVDAAITIRLAHNQATWTLGSDRRQTVRESAAWRAPKAEGGDLLGAPDRTSAAGRHAEREAAETAATVMERADDPEAREAERARGAQTESRRQLEEQRAREARARAEEQLEEQRAREARARAEQERAQQERAQQQRRQQRVQEETDRSVLQGLLGSAGGEDTLDLTIDEDGAGGSRAPAGDADRRIQIGAIRVEGDLDEQVIRRGLRARLIPLEACYDAEGARAPTRAIEWQLRVGPDGRVTDASASGVSDALAGCVGGTLRRVRFPPGADRVVVVVRVALEVSGR